MFPRARDSRSVHPVIGGTSRPKAPDRNRHRRPSSGVVTRSFSCCSTGARTYLGPDDHHVSTRRPTRWLTWPKRRLRLRRCFTPWEDSEGRWPRSSKALPALEPTWDARRANHFEPASLRPRPDQAVTTPPLPPIKPTVGRVHGPARALTFVHARLRPGLPVLQRPSRSGTRTRTSRARGADAAGRWCCTTIPVDRSGHRAARPAEIGRHDFVGPPSIRAPGT